MAELAAEGSDVRYTRDGSIEIALDAGDVARIDAMASVLEGDNVAYE